MAPLFLLRGETFQRDRERKGFAFAVWGGEGETNSGLPIASSLATFARGASKKTHILVLAQEATEGGHRRTHNVCWQKPLALPELTAPGMHSPRFCDHEEATSEYKQHPFTPTFRSSYELRTFG